MDTKKKNEYFTMKTGITIMLGLMCLVAFTVWDPSNDEIPEKVLRAFAKKYDQAKSVEWINRHPVYVVSFIQKEKDYYCRYNAQGKWLEEGVIIAAKEIPENVLGKLYAKIPSSLATDYYKVNLLSGEIGYLCKGQDWDYFYEVLLSKVGKQLREEKIDQSTISPWREYKDFIEENDSLG